MIVETQFLMTLAIAVVFSIVVTSVGYSNHKTHKFVPSNGATPGTIGFHAFNAAETNYKGTTPSSQPRQSKHKQTGYERKTPQIQTPEQKLEEQGILKLLKEYDKQFPNDTSLSQEQKYKLASDIYNEGKTKKNA